MNLDRCDYPTVAKCKINGNYQYKIRKLRPVQASEQVEEEEKKDVEEKKDEEDKPETGDFEVDPRCEGSDPFKPMHYKHVSDCSKVVFKIPRILLELKLITFHNSVL